MSQNDLKIDPSGLPRAVGGRREIFDRLLSVDRDGVPPIARVDDPHRTALEKERRRIFGENVDHRRAAEARAKAERIRAWEPELEGLDDDMREATIRDLEEYWEPQRRRPEPGPSPDPRLVEIADELRAIDEDGRRLWMDERRRMAQIGREMVRAARPADIKLAVDYLVHQHK